MKNIVIALLIALCFMLYLQGDKTEKEANDLKYQKLSVPDPVEGDYSNIKSWDFEQWTWETYSKPQNLSDEEIRTLREKHSYKNDGSYIYTPGRRVKTREQEIQEYIDDNIDEIIDEHQN